jgi:hypothetical protein
MVRATRSVDCRQLLRESLTRFQPIYPSLLILGIPSLIISFVNAFLTEGTLLRNALTLIYFLVIVPWFAGAAILYIYRYLTQEPINVLRSLQLTLPKLPQLILGFLLLLLILVPAFILLVIPGIYLSVRFGFALYAIAIENISALDGLTRSWDMVKGRWWSVFWAQLLGSFVFFFPIGLISGIIGTTYGTEAIATQISSAVLGFLVTPLLSLYFVLIYLRLRAIEDDPTEIRGT